MQNYVTDDVVVIWHLEDDVAVYDVDTLHVKRMDCSGSHKYRYRDVLVGKVEAVFTMPQCAQTNR
jgi:hypothetical protein